AAGDDNDPDARLLRRRPDRAGRTRERSPRPRPGDPRGRLAPGHRGADGLDAPPGPRPARRRRARLGTVSGMAPGTGRLLAAGAGAPLDQGVASLLFVATLLFGWLAYARLRGRGFSKLPRAAGWGAAGLAAPSLVLALVLPPIIRPSPPAARPAATGA